MRLVMDLKQGNMIAYMAKMRACVINSGVSASVAFGVSETDRGVALNGDKPYARYEKDNSKKEYAHS